MKRSSLFLAILLFCTLSPLCGYAQGFPQTFSGLVPIPGFPGVGPQGSCSSCGGNAACDVGGCTVNSIVRAGYSKMGLNFNVPVPNQAGLVTFDIDHLDLKLDDANLWLGSVQVNVLVTPEFEVFVEGWGSAGRSVRNEMIEDPIFAANAPIVWDSSLEWWELGFGASYRFLGIAGITGGLKFDHLSGSLSDPRAVGGPVVPAVASRIEGDLTTKLTIPYIGMVVGGSNCRGAILYSPFAWAHADLPLNSLFLLNNPLLAALEAATYSFNKSGQYIEGLLDYTVRWPGGVNVGLWARGTYLKFRGSGEESLEINTSGAVVVNATLGDSATSTLTRSILAGGLSAGLTF